MAETKARHIANLVEDDGDVKSAHLDNITVTPTAVSDQANTSTGYLDLPSGTTAQRPGTATSGNLRFNTDEDSLEFYTGTSWAKTSEPTPTISSISGTIYVGIAGKSLTITGTDFNTNNVSIEWLDGTTRIVKEDSITPTSATSITRAIPASVYGKATGTTIGIRVLNAGSVASNIDTSKSVLGIPTGSGSGHTLDTTSVSGYRIHTFQESGTLTVPSGFSVTAEYLVIAGGGGGGSHVGGGGGAGGMLESSSYTLNSTQTITIGAGGSGATDTSGTGGTSGDDTTAFGVTADGGGVGGSGYGTGGAGGSGGGCGHGNGTNNSTSSTGGGARTSGQGNRGGGGNQTGQHAAGGGGGKGGVGGDAGSSGNVGGTGGVGKQNSINGTNHYWAGGGGGSSGVGGSATAGSGGLGGGGGGGSQPNGTVGSGGGSALNSGASGSSYTGGNGGNNTGGGAGGGGHQDGDGGNGGKGIVIIRYQL